jgi:tRNA A37 methylthiotransferase MiaB
LNFAQKYEFNSVSVFGYHDEPLADSSKLKNKVPENIIKNRLEKLKKLLNSIYSKKEELRK